MAEAPAPGRDEILRITAPNSGPMTLAGTNTYLVGRDSCWVIDPGPADPGHIDRVRECAADRGGIGGVVLTHAHADHSDGVELLGEPLAWGSCEATDEAAALASAWTRIAAEERVDLAALDAPARAGELPAAPGGAAAEPGSVGPFEVLPTPGHSTDHVAFIYGEVIFCGDLILGEGSSIVPPSAGGGSLRAYMKSLELLADRGAALLCPGHGPWITEPAAKIAEYREHRLTRERDLLAALERGERYREALLDTAWGDVAEPLRPAAAIAMQAHLEKLAAEGRLPSPGTA